MKTQFNVVFSILFFFVLTTASCQKPGLPPCPGGQWDPNEWNPNTNSYGAWWCPDNGNNGNNGGNGGGGNDGSSMGYGFVVGDIYILTAVSKVTSDKAAAVDFDGNCSWDGVPKSNGTFEENRDYQLIPGFKCIGSTYRMMNGVNKKVWVFIQDMVLVERKYMENYAVSQSYIALGYDVPYIAISPRTYNPATPIEAMVVNESVSTAQVVPGHGIAVEYDHPVGFKSVGMDPETNLCQFNNGAYWEIQGKPTVLTKRVQ